jgi:hypothetical protein
MVLLRLLLLHGELVVFLIYRLLFNFTLDAAAAANYR